MLRRAGILALLVLVVVPVARMLHPEGAVAAAPSFRIVLTYEDAVQIVRESGGAVHRCKRLAPRRFRCRATWWYARHEAEEEPDGSLVNETVSWIPVEETRVVGLRGIARTF